MRGSTLQRRILNRSGDMGHLAGWMRFVWGEKMERRAVYLGNFDNAVRFVNAVEDSNIRMAFLVRGKVIDAKSLLGILSLDLKEPLLLEINGDEDGRKNVLRSIREFLWEK